MDDHELARSLATTAGELLLDLRRGAAGPVGCKLGDEGDRRSHALLAESLRRHRPRDAVRSEEGGKTSDAALLNGRLWIIDPLDGTKEYCDRDRADWAVHVALAERGKLVAGAVALPAHGRTYATDDPVRLAADPPHARYRVAVSRSHRPALVDALAEELDIETVPMGSAGVKVIAVLTGAADAYVHAGGQYEWDSAAPVAVASAAGAHTSRADGSELVYGNASPSIPDLLVCRPAVAETMLAAIGAAARKSGMR
ncbi:3'(2'),5'-bisphosphate nucleotidase CysQ [Amycolatopsis minnesotensis]|uniref:inositol-phosphate phosphatase n=1 Tax=Amycolatopsis minnesotensis TaxID=337894 RepID=A0ABP5D4Y0_9PSEU